MSDGPDAAGGLDGDAGGGDFAGIDGDFGGIEGMDGAGGLDADFDIADSLMISFDGDGGEWSDALCDEDANSTIEIDRVCRPSHEHQLTEAQKDALEKIANNPLRNFFAAHVFFHGPIDVMEIFGELATQMGCNRVDTVTPHLPGADVRMAELTDWDRTAPPFTRNKVPMGWYPGAFGSTRIVRQYWQIKKPDNFFNRDPEPERRFDRLAGVVLEVVAITWSYHEPDDYETRFQILVKTYAEWVPSAQEWGIRANPFKRHQSVARKLVDAVALKIRDEKPDWQSRYIRKEIKDRLEAESNPGPKPGPEDGSDSDCSEGSGSGADLRAILTKPSKKVDIEFPL